MAYIQWPISQRNARVSEERKFRETVRRVKVRLVWISERKADMRQRRHREMPLFRGDFLSKNRPEGAPCPSSDAGWDGDSVRFLLNDAP
uniref:Uncharacterized protein n=1 Tax=Candidatus Kentrum sp. DK TaxID=2126562 RepID=A0A450SSB9_9GAMM|nr:MAG: hypothetical protein BECKDK2373B_GA0170837_106215 [Candidatus Kentron sp. DK]VFJ59068.1 MAG: hypothetical protein BECKDK2373C_GA0170839_106915 [Candidatus Kentron sp. DK]